MNKTESLLILNPDYVFTMNKGKGVLRGAALYCEGPYIEEVGGDKQTADRVIDARGMIVVPGLINTHDHLFQTGMQALPGLKKLRLMTFIERLCALASEGLDEEAMYHAAAVGMIGLLLSGCTTTSSHEYMHPRQQSGLFGAGVRAAKDLGIRYHPVRGCLSANKFIDWPEAVTETREQVLTRSEEAITAHHDPGFDSMCRVALGPCGYYSASSELFRGIVELAGKRGVRLHTHALEASSEDNDCGGALRYLQDLGFMGGNSWLAHAIFVSEADIRLLAATGTGVTHAPWCALAKKRIPPIIQMTEAEVKVGIGTDGAASNGENMLRQCQLAGRLQGQNPGYPAGSYLRPYETLMMATMGGAACLGREKEIGSIEPGKLADLVLIDPSQHLLDTAGFHDPLGLIFESSLNSVDTVIINGRVVVDQGKPTVMNEIKLEKLFLRHMEISRRMVAGAERKLGISLTDSYG